MRERLQRFFQGRYGTDELNRFLMYVMAACLVLSFIAGSAFYIIGIIVMFTVYFRMFSKNRYRRAAENQIYLRYRDRVRNFFRSRFHRGGKIFPGNHTSQGSKTSQGNRAYDSTHRIYPCPSCKQKIRVPKGKGKIAIYCPKCGREFVKRT